MRRFTTTAFVALSLITGWLSACGFAVADGDLLRFVPREVGICIEARDLHTAISEFVDGPMFARWTAHPALAKWHAEQRAQLEKASQQLKRQFGVSLDDLKSRLFGKQWVLGVVPTVAGASGPPDGFLLVNVADAALLASSAEKLFETQRAESRYVGKRESTFGDRTYSIHELKADEDHSVFITYDGDFGALAVRRSTLEKVLQLRGGGDRGGATSMDETPEFKTAYARLSADAHLRAFARPQVWIQKSVNGDGVKSSEAVDFSQMINFVAAAVRLGTVTRIEAVVEWDRELIPDALRNVVDGLRGDTAAAAPVPADALAAIAVRADMRQIATAVLSLAERDAEARGKPTPAEALIAARLLGALGPNLSAAVTRAAVGDEMNPRLPVDWLVSVDTQSPAAGEPSLAAALDPLIRIGLGLAAEVYNEHVLDTARIEAVRRSGIDVTGITGLGPLGLGQLFVARRDGRFWVGGSKEIVSSEDSTSGEAAGDDKLATEQTAAKLHDPRLTTRTSYAFVNTSAAVDLIDDLLSKPPTWLAPLQTEPMQAKVRELQRLLSLIDAALLEATVDERSAQLTLAITVNK